MIMDYTNFLPKSAVETLEKEYSIVNDLNTVDKSSIFAVYYPWNKTADFNVIIKHIDGETLFLECMVDNPYVRSYKKHANVDFSKITLFIKEQMPKPPKQNPNIGKYSKNRFIQYFKKKT